MAATATQRQKRTKYGRLCEVMRRDRKVLEPYRQQFVKAMRDYAGAGWSDRASDKQMPLNMLDMFVRAWTRSLVPQNPKFLMTTWERKYEAQVKQAEQWANDEAKRLRLDLTLQRWAFNALFLFGTVKIDLATPEEASIAGGRRAGSPYIKLVEFDDWVGDMHANTFEEMAYEGYRFRVPLEALKESKRYNQKAVAELVPSLDPRYNEEGDERASHIGRNDYDFTEELEDMVDLWWVFTRRDRRQIVMAAPDIHVPGGEGEHTVLLDKPWFGPEEGPFEHMELGIPPAGNPFPKAPAMDLVFPNECINNLARKQLGQAGRQKSVGVGRAGGDADAKTAQAANDGDFILLQDPNSVSELRFGGPDAANFQLFDYLTQKFDQMAGNLSTRLGLQSLAGTKGQEDILNANSSASEADTQERATSAVSRACQKLMWWWWYHPKQVMRTVKEVEGFPEYNRTRYLFPNDKALKDNPRFKGQMRTAKMGRDFEVKIDPHSMQFTPPAQRANEIMGIVMQAVMPVIGALKQQGKELDWDYLFETVARYKDLPELKRVLQSAELPPEGLGGEAQEQGGGSQGGGGEYIRKSEGNGQAGPDHAAAMAAAQNNKGGQPQ